jgi:hypothetical protein
MLPWYILLSFSLYIYICINSSIIVALINIHITGTMVDEASPLVILGPPGTGKTALISNWIQQREVEMRHPRHAMEKEYIFYHQAGCSLESSLVKAMLFRCMTEMKTYFKLTTEIVRDENRLCWEFPRLLAACARKGRVILFLDSVNTFKMDAGKDVNLRWLPNTFPPNVRVIVTISTAPPPQMIYRNSALSNFSLDSTVDAFRLSQPLLDIQIKEISAALNNTVNNDSNGKKAAPFRTRRQSKSERLNATTKEKVLAEVERRGWPSVSIQEMDEQQKATFLLKYLCTPAVIERRTHNFSTVSGYIHEHDIADDKSYLDHDDVSVLRRKLILFPSQQVSILTHPCTSNPLFFRLLLDSLAAFAHLNANIWQILESFLNCLSYEELLQQVTFYWENGVESSVKVVNECVAKVIENGGAQTLLKGRYL